MLGYSLINAERSTILVYSHFKLQSTSHVQFIGELLRSAFFILSQINIALLYPRWLGTNDRPPGSYRNLKFLQL